MLRRRRVNIKAVKELDAFPKVPEPYIDKTAVGGTFSVFTICIITYLIIAETRYFLDSRWQFKFEPDTDIDAKLQINIDITVAMRCSRIGADVLDSTNANLFGLDTLEEEDTWWELSREQRTHFDVLKHMNSYFREEYHAIHELLWKSNQITLVSEMPKRTHKPNYPPDACRIYGSLLLNKVAGNFHITAGKSLPLPRGHIHVSAFMSDRDYNFTHRINKFSFGGPSPGIVHPLEGDEKISNDHMLHYQYFIEVVPTDIRTLLSTYKTYQYSVKDHQQTINHDKGSHGIPGIFFKYDMSALKIKVTQQRDTVCQFLVKLCATVGGVFVTSGLIKNIVQGFFYVICCKFMNSSDEMSDKQRYAPPMITNQPSNMAPVDLLNNPMPENINILLNPQ